MPARKPAGLITRDETKEDKRVRVEAEAAMTPCTPLSKNPPASLKRNKGAQAVWRRVVGLYNETAGKIATAFDENLLVKYCLAEVELLTLEAIRDELFTEWKRIGKQVKPMKPTAGTLRDYLNLLTQYNALIGRYQGMDGRIDNKRKMLVDMEQALYLTPRSRAGVEPPLKELEKPKDSMEKLLEKKKNVRPVEGG